MNVGWVRADQENRAGSEQRLCGAGYGCPVKPSAAAHRVTVNEGKAAASSHPRSPPLREQVTMNRGVLDVMRPYGNRGRVLVGRRAAVAILASVGWSRYWQFPLDDVRPLWPTLRRARWSLRIHAATAVVANGTRVFSWARTSRLPASCRKSPPSASCCSGLTDPAHCGVSRVGFGRTGGVHRCAPSNR